MSLAKGKSSKVRSIVDKLERVSLSGRPSRLVSVCSGAPRIIAGESGAVWRTTPDYDRYTRCFADTESQLPGEPDALRMCVYAEAEELTDNTGDSRRNSVVTESL